ncbi:uncharacterized protein LOC118564236 [Fundulus heteroclitus]|uniref:uncharacterized protein LOC118564236 n=1 Tax=Fundulus heteroclitus TaxID=8078 RepID=UPI00165B06A8|nr:uncharacterized protein LOC118564236 [Fundulus heteroclitus]
MHHILNMAGLYTFWLLLSWAGLIHLINTAESAPKCSYSVEEIRVGFLIQMIDFTAGKYAINATEKEGPFEWKDTVSFSNDDSTHQINFLKPCTEYELNVALISSNGREILCTKTGDKTTTGINFIDPNDINQTNPIKLPPNIKATFPPSCKNLSVEYKCSGEDNTFVEPSDMKPFTDYSCTGLIKNNNVFINKKTPPVHFNIDCDFIIGNLRYNFTDTSLHLNWETISEECQDVLHNLEKLSYRCSCQDVKTTEVKESKESVGRTCDFRGLKPYTYYRCQVRPIYDDRDFTREYVTINMKRGMDLHGRRQTEANRHRIHHFGDGERPDIPGCQLFTVDLQGKVSGGQPNPVTNLVLWGRSPPTVGCTGLITGGSENGLLGLPPGAMAPYGRETGRRDPGLHLFSGEHWRLETINNVEWGKTSGGGGCGINGVLHPG